MSGAGKPDIIIRRGVRGLNVDRQIDAVVKKTAAYVLESEGCDSRFEITVTYTDNESICELNREFRNIDRATDVLSFPMLNFFDGKPQEDFSCDRDPDSGYLYLGDIVISAQKADEQAAEYGHSREREFAFLTAHSMLHLLGYDHERGDAARIDMERRQEAILNDLGIFR